MKQLLNGSQMAGKVALCPFRHTFTAPRDQNTLGKTAVGILDFCKSKLNATVGKVLNELLELTLCNT